MWGRFVASSRPLVVCWGCPPPAPWVSVPSHPRCGCPLTSPHSLRGCPSKPPHGGQGTPHDPRFVPSVGAEPPRVLGWRRARRHLLASPLPPSFPFSCSQEGNLRHGAGGRGEIMREVRPWFGGILGSLGWWGHVHSRGWAPRAVPAQTRL